MDWTTFTISILGSSVIAALVTAVVNGLMNHRTQIQAIKESGLYAKRADILDEMMKRMERLDRIMGELVSPFRYCQSKVSETKRRNDTWKAFDYFFEYYKRNRHYLPEQLSNDIERLCREYKEMCISFSYSADSQGGKPNYLKWQELIKKHSNDFSKKKELIAGEFRKIIGVK